MSIRVIAYSKDHNSKNIATMVPALAESLSESSVEGRIFGITNTSKEGRWNARYFEQISVYPETKEQFKEAVTEAVENVDILIICGHGWSQDGWSLAPSDKFEDQQVFPVDLDELSEPSKVKLLVVHSCNATLAAGELWKRILPPEGVLLAGNGEVERNFAAKIIASLMIALVSFPGKLSRDKIIAAVKRAQFFVQSLHCPDINRVSCPHDGADQDDESGNHGHQSVEFFKAQNSFKLYETQPS